MDRPKQPRRFACDRCRIYKLRCERVSTEGNSCNRCIKFGIFCETTNAQGLGAKSKTTQRRSAHTLFGDRTTMTPQSGTAPTQRIAPPPIEAQASAALSLDPHSTGMIIDPASSFPLNMMENHESPQSYDEITRSIPPSGGLQDPSELTVDTTTIRDHPETHRSTSGHRDLLELSANLIDDIDRLNGVNDSPTVSPNPAVLETATQRALSQTNVLIRILKRLEIEGEEDKAQDCDISDTFVSQDSGSSSRNPDVLFASTLITSYILIIRYWQKLFLHIKRLHVEDPDASTKPLPILPALLFGGVQATANLDIQFMVLLETCSSMIQLIEAYLGVSSSGVMRFTETVIEKKTLLHDPISISVRETLLSVEGLQNARRDGAPPLKETMRCMQEHVLSRCCRLNSKNKVP
ncbi:hypothetical protein ANO14919_120490 [Xylariales sp. No.14919]|nr:hypothetical protein ANO14919_120490 [Xylariales sp. No.14919]